MRHHRTRWQWMLAALLLGAPACRQPSEGRAAGEDRTDSAAGALDGRADTAYAPPEAPGRGVSAGGGIGALEGRADTAYAPPEAPGRGVSAGGGIGALPDEMPRAERPVRSAAPADHARGNRVGDRAPSPVATPAELARLRASLAMPLAGVDIAKVPDSFDDARGARRHEALDILAPRGTPVLAATDGRLLKIFTSENGGLMLYAADASERFILVYAHLDRYAPGLAEGMRLRRGQTIGYVGTTGNAPPGTPHLHFAIARAGDVREWWRGTPVNPRPLLAR